VIQLSGTDVTLAEHHEQTHQFVSCRFQQIYRVGLPVTLPLNWRQSVRRADGSLYLTQMTTDRPGKLTADIQKNGAKRSNCIQITIIIVVVVIIILILLKDTQRFKMRLRYASL